MEQNLKTPRKIGPKTLVTVKFMLTVSLFIFYIIPLVIFLYVYGKLNLSHQTLEKLTICLFLLSQILIGIFILIRWSIIKKHNYKYKKSEKVLVIVYLSLLLGTDIIFTFVTFFSLYFNDGNVSKIIFYIFEPIVFCLGIGSSTVEQISRKGEQIWIYNNWYVDEALEDDEIIVVNEIKSSDIKEGEIKNSKNPFKDEWENTIDD